MSSKLTWQDYYKSLELEKGVAGVEGVTGRIAGDGSYDGPLKTTYKKQIPDFSSVKTGDNYPGKQPKVPNQAHPDDEDPLGMMDAPKVPPFKPYDVEKLKTMRSVGKFAEATKNLSDKDFIKVLLEANKDRPSPKTIKDLHGDSFTPQPYEVISYLVSLFHNPRILSRLISEIKKYGYMKDLVQDLLDRPDFYDCIVKCMDHEERGPKIAGRLVKSMADHHLDAIGNSNLAEAVSPALEDDLPPEDDNQESNGYPSDQPQGNEGEPSPEGEENKDGDSEEEESDDLEISDEDENVDNKKKEHGDEDKGEGEDEGDDLELSDEEEMPGDDGGNPSMKKESLHHKNRRKLRKKRKLPHHHMIDAMRPYFGVGVTRPYFGIPIGFDRDHDSDDTPSISLPSGGEMDGN